MATSQNCAPMRSRLLYLLTNFHFQLNRLSFVKWPSYSVKSMSLFGVVLQFCYFWKPHIQMRFKYPTGFSRLETTWPIWLPFTNDVHSNFLSLLQSLNFLPRFTTQATNFHFPNIRFLSVETRHKSLQEWLHSSPMGVNSRSPVHN